MSTRATYSFATRIDDELIVNFYIHHDNYPTGAAYYFWRMHNNAKKYWSTANRSSFKGGLAEIFIKSNADTVEFTLGHDYHGDTEYQYHMERDGMLTATAIKNDGTHVIIFKGHYGKFISEYDELLQDHPDYEPLYPLSEDVKDHFCHYFKYIGLHELKSTVTSVFSQTLSPYREANIYELNKLKALEQEYRRIASLAKDKDGVAF